MQRFLGIANDIVNVSYENFNYIEKSILNKLEYSSATRLIINLESLKWQKAIIAIGLFSLFESNMQSLYSSNKNTLNQIIESLKR